MTSFFKLTACLIALISTSILIQLVQSEQLSGTNQCISKKTCGACIQTNGCAWCISKEFKDRSRCFQTSITSSNVCPEDDIIDPDNQQITVMDSEMIEMQPQRLSLKLRANQPHTFNFKYSLIEDFPVDIYYLMDLSKSMEKDKEKLSALANLLSSRMKNITLNLRLGFGSFAGNVNTSPVSKKLNNNSCENCESPYGFINHMPLTKDISTFSEKVRNIAVSDDSLDASKAGFGFHGIMQAIVCRDQIGWRHEARRFLIFSTNADVNNENLDDGIETNDGMCHMEGNKYTHSNPQSYPTISQLNEKIRQNYINMIFAVTSDQRVAYSNLSYQLEGSTFAILADDSSNVVDLVQDEFSKISATIEMKDNSSDAIEITYYTSCLDRYNKPTPQNKCNYLKMGDVVTFTAEILITSCPENPNDWRQTFQIYPVGIKESLIVDLEMLCSCKCERPDHHMFEKNSLHCSGHGSYNCGICSCDPLFAGEYCECSSLYHVEDGCRFDNTTQIDCSGRGTCVCGTCECYRRPKLEEILYGKFCECDNFTCERFNGIICSGPDHGVCECGSCRCMSGWKGEACEVSTVP